MRKFCSIFSLFLVFLCSSPLEAQINFSQGAVYSYLKSSAAGSLPATWMLDSYNYSSWSTGAAPFRYGDGSGGTLLSDMQNTYSCVYLRTDFNAVNAANITEMTISVNYDDGFILWINGEDILNINAPDIPSPTEFAPENHESGSFETFQIIPTPGLLREGQNHIAIQAFNVSLESSDFYFDMAMSGTASLPEYNDTLGISFSHPSGFYTSAFNLTVSHPDPDVKIYYTLDGTNPQELVSGKEISPGANVIINPLSSILRTLTPAVTLRASVVKEGFRPSKPVARTYIYIEQVKLQSYPGGSWPTGTVNDQSIDLPMDSRVVNDPLYSDLIDDALLEIPTISIITDLKNLFDPATGIYVNAMQHGEFWERECSVELINPDGSEGFNVNAGLRIRGGWSRHGEFAKHAFRLLFKGEYGTPKLRFPLFGDEGVDHFDNVDLRTAQNYAWSNGDPHNTMAREVFSRDLQRDMDQPYTRSRYYHLYLDGMYWGLFQTQERSEANFAADYLGGEAEDYDVIKVATDNSYNIEATDGNRDGWSKIYIQCLAGFSTNARYFGLMGCDEFGEPVPGAETLLDVDNLIDYMLTIFYSGNFDAPTSSFGQNKGPNNFYAINSRTNKSDGFKFFNHDAEHALFSEAHSPGTGLYEDRVNIGTLTTYMKMQVSSFEKFHPQWLHFKLSDNEEYRQRFMDRAWLHMSEGGALSPKKCKERFNARTYQIDTAIIAESARWGDGRSWVSTPYTKNKDWIPELNKVKNAFIPFRTAILEDQLLQAGLYTVLAPPEFWISSELTGGLRRNFSESFPLEIKNTESSSAVYYTTDGSDPRMIGGGINEEAEIMESLSMLKTIDHTCYVKARTYKYGEWSAMKQMYFLKTNEDYSNLKITEMHFHPPDKIVGTDTISGKRFEFIEFKNTGDHALNLSGMRLDSAIEYTFPANTLLPAGKFYVIVSKSSTFYDTYGMKASGNFEGFLENKGEEILLLAPDGREVIRFTYAIEYPWPTSASGTGHSLVSTQLNPVDDPAYGWYWTVSKNKGGSPFKDEPPVASNGKPVLEEALIRVFPNPATAYLDIQLSGSLSGQDTEIRIYNLSGNMVHQEIINGDTRLMLDKPQFTGGIYILEFRSAEKSETFRLVIQK